MSKKNKVVDEKNEVHAADSAFNEADDVREIPAEIVDSMMNEIQPENVVYDRQRIAIFMKNWMEATLLAHGLPNKCLKSWKVGQVVYGKEDVERLISLKAPIRIFVEDGTH